jgi:hypothetical protein
MMFRPGSGIQRDHISNASSSRLVNNHHMVRAGELYSGTRIEITCVNEPGTSHTLS